jgi:phospholipase C
MLVRIFAFTVLVVGGCSHNAATPDGSEPAIVDDAGVDDADLGSDGTGGNGVVDGGTPADLADPGPSLDELRAACTFGPGAKVADTLGFGADARKGLPIDHVVVIMQENRSFDHYLGRMTQFGHAVDGTPATYTNPDGNGAAVAPKHATTTCIGPDLPHSYDNIHSEWDNGKMDAFYKTAGSNNNADGSRALAWYDQTDLPFYYWLYSTFAMSDRFFAAVLGPTWPNRDFLYAGTSDGVKNTGERAITVKTLYDQLDAAKIAYAVYADGTPRQDCISWTSTHAGFHATTADYFTAAAAGKLPPVVFIDGNGANADEHPTNDVQKGEAFVRKIMTESFKSPHWPHMAIILTYDEAGGFFDHVPPPPACVPSKDAANADFNRLGIRLPMVVVSPYSRAGYVSHVPQEISSITRFIELVNDLPAMTRRDANATALLDLFDFSAPHLTTPPAAPAAGTGGCH